MNASKRYLIKSSVYQLPFNHSVLIRNDAQVRLFSRKRRKYKKPENSLSSNIRNIIYGWKHDDSRDKLKLPKGLTTEERKYIHLLARRNKLKSKSRGRGDKRYITLSKDFQFWHDRHMIADTSKEREDLDDKYLPVLTLEAKTSSTLKKYLKDFPPSVLDDHGISSTVDDYNSEIIKDESSQSSNKRESISKRQMKKRSRWHNEGQLAKSKHPEYRKMEEARAKLPVYKYRKEICDIVRNNRVTILTGDTGKLIFEIRFWPSPPLMQTSNLSAFII